jgi:hypothetical protein
LVFVEVEVDVALVELRIKKERPMAATSLPFIHTTSPLRNNSALAPAPATLQ